MNSIQYLGHACFLLNLGGKRIICDPFIRHNSLANKIVDIDNLEVDFVLLTHGHEDHVADAEELSLRNGAPIIANFEVASWFEEKGCMTKDLNPGGRHDFGFGEVRMVTAIHSSSMPDGSYGGNPNGYLIKNGPDVIYIAGDTGLTKDMELIPAFYGKPTIAILPIGGYYTMDYEDAVHAADMIECNKVIGSHFNTFPPITIDKEKAMSHFTKNGKNLTVPNINEIINL